ncbi:MAG: hypothetical protein H5U17_13605 [Defluviimonas sp.]|nr:hypothetical protein [Defluviimonas sp.]
MEMLVFRTLFLATFVVCAVHNLPADAASSSQLGAVVDDYVKAHTACQVSGDYEGEECRNGFALEKRLLDLGWCRHSGKEVVLQRCSMYRRYITSPNLVGLNFGFENWSDRRGFTVDLAGLLPSAEGENAQEQIGKMTIICSPDGPPFVSVETNAAYPEFAVRADTVNFFATLEGADRGGVAMALLQEEDGGGHFAFQSAEMVQNILEYFSADPFNSPGELTLRFAAYSPDAALDLNMTPLLFDFDAMRHADEIKQRLGEFAARCATSPD